MRFLAPAVAACLALPAGAFDVQYEYSLSTVTGVIPFAGVKLGLDPQHKEIFVIGDGLVRIFNQGGMEIFAFGDDADLGRPVGAVALPDGDMVILAYGVDGYAVVRCNFRGEPIRKLTLSGAPAGFLDDFHPGAIALANDKLFLADLRAMTVLVSDLEGKVVASHDLAKLLEVEARRQELGVRGFNVDKDGNILFTVQPLFRAFVLAPDGTVKGFGERGSAPGKFNILGGIARDDQGRLYVTDLLKSAVLVFDAEYHFLKEFGYRGRKPSNLAAPIDVAVADGRIYVAQNARRGVSVYQVAADPN